MAKLSETQHLYVVSMGKALRVMAVFPETDEGTAAANRHMARTNDAVVAVMAGVVLLADKGDRGTPIQRYSLQTG
jgi:hypothetical protein